MSMPGVLVRVCIFPCPCPCPCSVPCLRPVTKGMPYVHVHVHVRSHGICPLLCPVFLSMPGDYVNVLVRVHVRTVNVLVRVHVRTAGPKKYKYLNTLHLMLPTWPGSSPFFSAQYDFKNQPKIWSEPSGSKNTNKILKNPLKSLKTPSAPETPHLISPMTSFVTLSVFPFSQLRLLVKIKPKIVFLWS
jgi:hypothetical protein